MVAPRLDIHVTTDLWTGILLLFWSGPY